MVHRYAPCRKYIFKKFTNFHFRGEFCLGRHYIYCSKGCYSELVVSNSTKDSEFLSDITMSSLFENIVKARTRNMKHLKTILVTLIMLSMLVMPLLANNVATKGAEVGKWTMDYDAALALAKKKDLPLLLNFTGSDWCGWCKFMDRNVFSKAEWKNYALENVVLVTLDFPRDQSIVPAQFVNRNYEMQSKFGVTGYPTFMILENDGATVLGKLGAAREMTPGIFIEQMEDALMFRQSKIDEAVSKLSPGKAKKYLKLIDTVKQTEEKMMAWLKTGPLNTEANQEKYRGFIADITTAREQLKDF